MRGPQILGTPWLHHDNPDCCGMWVPVEIDDRRFLICTVCVESYPWSEKAAEAWNLWDLITTSLIDIVGDGG